ncbi:MAG TPA: histidine triad nucleotide-binding protein [Marmoricola sp.]
MADPDCLFCKIIAREVPGDIVFENEHALAFRDIAPAAPVHVLVVPKEHLPNAAAVAEHDSGHGTALSAELIRAAAQVAASEGLDNGYRLVFNTGADAQQTVFHAHLHVLGGRPMGWPPG